MTDNHAQHQTNCTGRQVPTTGEGGNEDRVGCASVRQHGAGSPADIDADQGLHSAAQDLVEACRSRGEDVAAAVEKYIRNADHRMPPEEHIETLHVLKEMVEDSLTHFRAGPFLRDYFDEVQGLRSEEATGYQPTRHELEILASHWAKTRLAINVFCYLSRQTSSCEGRQRHYADLRLQRLDEVMGKSAVDAVIAEVEEQKRKEIGEEAWRVYTGEATEEEARQWWESMELVDEEQEGDSKAPAKAE